MIKNQLVQNVFEQIKTDGRFEAAVTAIVNQEMDPYAACDRGGCIHAFDALNHFFLISQMIIPGPSHWNLDIGRNRGQVEKDEQGIKTMKVLGQNMAWLLKKIQS